MWARAPSLVRPKSHCKEVMALTFARARTLAPTFSAIRSCPSPCRYYAPRNRGMRVKEPFHPRGRRTFRKILFRKFVHRRNERLNRWDGAESVAVGLALVETGVGVEQWKHQQ